MRQPQYPQRLSLTTGTPMPMIGHEGLLKLVALMARLRAAHAVTHEEGASCPHPQFPPPITRPIVLWEHLPPSNRRRVLWVLTQLLERQVAITAARTETQNDTRQ